MMGVGVGLRSGRGSFRRQRCYDLGREVQFDLMVLCPVV